MVILGSKETRGWQIWGFKTTVQYQYSLWSAGSIGLKFIYLSQPQTNIWFVIVFQFCNPSKWSSLTMKISECVSFILSLGSPPSAVTLSFCSPNYLEFPPFILLSHPHPHTPSILVSPIQPSSVLVSVSPPPLSPGVCQSISLGPGVGQSIPPQSWFLPVHPPSVLVSPSPSPLTPDSFGSHRHSWKLCLWVS